MSPQTFVRLAQVSFGGSFALRLLVAVTCLWLIAGAVALMAGRRSASLRHRVWALATAAVLAAPVLAALLPQWRIAVLPAGLSSSAPAAEQLAGRGGPVALRPQDAPALVELPAGEISAPSRTSGDEPPRLNAPAIPEVHAASHARGESDAVIHAIARRWPAVLLGVWGAVAGLLLGRQCLSILSAAKLAHRAIPVQGRAAEQSLVQLASEFGVHPPRLGASPSVPIAICAGVLRPTVLLPCDYIDWDRGRLRATLAHELAHAVRRDVPWQLLAGIARSLYWFHPLAWVAAWRMRVEREIACDDWVLRAGHRAAEYARLLVDLAESLADRRLAPMAGAVTMLNGRDLRQRLTAVLEAGRSRLPVSRRASKCLSVVAIGTLLAVATLRPVAAVQKDLRKAGAAATATQPGRSITGRVMGPDGKPVAGATVWHVVRRPGNVHVVAARSQTDSEGNFRIAPDPGFSEDYTTVVVRAESFGMGGQTLLAGDPAEVVLTPPATVRVTVLGPDGAPLARCRITPAYLVGSRTDSLWSLPLPPEVGQGLSVTTDAQGVCKIGGLPRHAKVWLDAVDDRFAHCDISDGVGTNADGSVTTGMLRLQPACSISGSVKFPDGKPAAGVEIVAQPITGFDVSANSGGAVTDARGEYHIRRLKAATYNVAAFLKGDFERDWTAAALQDVRVASGQDVRDADLALVRGGLIVGRVLKGDTNEPVPHVAVGLQGPSAPRTGAMIQRTVTDKAGRYTLRVPAGAQYVYFQDLPPEGYLRPRPEGQEPTVGDGQTVTIDIKLPRDPNPAVEGRVVTAEGRPAGGAIVTAELRGVQPPDNTRGTKADAGGRFRILGVPAGSLLRARLGHQATLRPVVAPAPGADLVLALSEEAITSVHVLVTDAAGAPIRDAAVELYVEHGRFGSGIEKLRTDKAGRCTFVGLSPDQRYSVDAEADGYGRTTSPVELRPGATLEIGPLRLARADQEISGHVLDSDGKGVAGVGVEINGVETGNHTTITGRDGAFRFAVVPQAHALLYLRGSDGNPLPAQSARSGNTDVRLHFEPRKPTTQPATLSPTSAGQSSERALRAALERRLPELRPGTYTIAEVLDFFYDISGIRIETDWESLGTAGVRRDTRITLQWKGVKFPDAISAVLDKAANPGVLTWQVSDGTALVRAKKGASS